MTSPWSELDDCLGVPVVFAPTQDARVSTNAAVAVTRRTGEDPREHSQRLTAALREHVSLISEALPSGAVVCDLAHDDSWIARLPTALGPRLATAAASIRAESPTVRLTSGTWAWASFVEDVGSDAASWALLRSASKVPPFVLGIDAVALAGRRDDNPLALVRRAHAAATLRLGEPIIATSADDGGIGLDRDPSLRSDVLLTSRALFDVERGGRTRPTLLAVEALARTTLAHVERTPVTRTDLPALAAARSILRECLDALGVAAPVPF